MTDIKVIVHVGENYVIGVVDQSFLNDNEIGGRNGDVYYSDASLITDVWDGTTWVAWDPNNNSNVGIDVLMFGMTSAGLFFGPDIGYVRKLQAEFDSSATDKLLLFKFASNATLGSDGTIGTWQKDPTAFEANNEVFADMETEWTQAKAALSTDVLRVQAIIVSHGRAEFADDDLSSAYEENLKKFLKDLRYLFLEDADDDPIPIIITKTGLTGGNYDLIRDAQDAMATALPYVKVIEMETDHVAVLVNDTLSGLGNLLLGNDIYDAYRVAKSEDLQEEYSLAALRTAIRREFGIDATQDSQTEMIDEKINEAMLWIAKQRSDWPWMSAEASIDIVAKRTEAATTVVQGERKVTGLTAPTKLRDLFVGGDLTTSDTDGYLIAGGNLTIGFNLQSKYLGASITAGNATIVQGYFKLPRDFSRATNVELIGDNNVTERMVFKSSLEFDKLKRQRTHLQGALSNIKTFYSIKPDPLKKTGDLYLVTYPFITESRVLQILYWKQPKKLVLPEDQSDLPRADGFVLLHAAFWFVSVAQKDDPDRITFYRVQALTSLTSMVENPRFSEEPDLPPSVPESQFVQMPPGFEQPGNLHA